MGGGAVVAAAVVVVMVGSKITCSGGGKRGQRPPAGAWMAPMAHGHGAVCTRQQRCWRASNGNGTEREHDQPHCRYGACRRPQMAADKHKGSSCVLDADVVGLGRMGARRGRRKGACGAAMIGWIRETAIRCRGVYPRRRCKVLERGARCCWRAITRCSRATFDSLSRGATAMAALG